MNNPDSTTGNASSNSGPAPRPDPGTAPADAIDRPPWPRWRKIVAYALLLALAYVSILVIDSKVPVEPDLMPAPAAAPAPPFAPPNH